MDWRKAAWWTLGVSALLVLAVAICLHLLVDPERLKKAARDKALSAWERELLLGDVRFDFFPVPSLPCMTTAVRIFAPGCCSG